MSADFNMSCAVFRASAAALLFVEYRPVARLILSSLPPAYWM